MRWLCDLVGYGAGSFGLCTSGGVMANFIALALVRDVHLRRLRGGDPPRGAALEGVRVYASDQTHFSIARALDELGFPRETLVVLPADDRFRLHAEPVAEAIAADRARGLTPVAICAVAGSTNTGSVDLVPELAALARREGLWLHVDAAYGGAARLSARDADRVPGLELADSVTVDPHKWFFQAYDLGGLLVRDGDQLRQAFDRSPEYYRGGEGTAARRGRRRTTTTRASSTSTSSASRAPAGSAPSSCGRAGSTWARRASDGSWSATSTSPRYLAACCRDDDDLETVPPTPELSVVCFRHLPGGAAAARAMDPRPSTPTRTGSRRRSRPPGTAGCPRRPCAARRTCAPASSTT